MTDTCDRASGHRAAAVLVAALAALGLPCRAVRAGEGEPAPIARGVLVGSTGGNERDVLVVARGGRVVHYGITYGEGAFRIEGLAPGPYMVLSAGRVASRVPIRPGRTTSLRFAEDATYALASSTWSPARRAFSQTFVADGSRIRRVTFWIPSGRHRLAVRIVEAWPGGKVVGERRLEDPVTWVVGVRPRGGAWRTEPGRSYRIEIASRDRTPWQIGMPGRGDLYPDGEAWFDDEPQLDADLALTIESDASGLVETAFASDGLGFIREGPGSGRVRAASQLFVARTRNIVAAYANAGWGSRPRRQLEFEFSIHDGGPRGERIGPPARVPMFSDWGQTAVWFPDEVPVVPGHTYALTVRRVDGEPFYAYLSRDAYPEGHAVRDGRPEEEFDLTFSIRGEEEPDRLVYPIDIRIDRSSEPWSLEWETTRPAHGRIARAERWGPVGVTDWSPDPATRHRASLEGLTPGREAWAAPVVRVPGGLVVRGPRTVLRAPASGDPSPEPVVAVDFAPVGAVVELANPGFEEGTLGWYVGGTLAGTWRGAPDLAPAEGRQAIGYRHVARAGEDVPRKIDPADRALVLQEVRLRPGREYQLSAVVNSREREGGWQRTNRVRLLAWAPAGGGGRLGRPLATLLADPGLRERTSSTWFATDGAWLRRRLRFRAAGARAVVGVELYRWWSLREDAVLVDSVRLEELPDRLERLPRSGAPAEDLPE